MAVEKRIVNQILKEYSMRKNEFTQCQDGSSFLSSIIKGYMITITPEEQDSEATGRFLVRHTDGTGRIQFIDTWNISDEKAIFVTRDTPKSMKKKSDYYYVKDLEKDNTELRKAYRELKENYEKLQNEKCVNNQDNNYTVEKKKIGRPTLEPQKIVEILELCKAGVPKAKIAKELGIERKTIYNVLKRNQIAEEAKAIAGIQENVDSDMISMGEEIMMEYISGKKDITQIASEISGKIRWDKE